MKWMRIIMLLNGQQRAREFLLCLNEMSLPKFYLFA